jgi:F0F1-type ATP synthase epsilon subunit
MAKKPEAPTIPKPNDKKKGPKEGDTFHLKVYSPFKNYYEGDVDSLSAVNDTGPFDILAGHHNFITLLNPCDLVIRAVNKDDEVIKITRGIMQVKADNVVIFLDV